MKTITLATFNTKDQAEPLRRRLEEAQIAVECEGRSAFRGFWFVAEPIAATRLNVKAEDYERALNLVHEWDAADGILSSAIKCPECHSSRVEYPQFTRKFYLPNILIGLLAAIGVVEKKFYCIDCQCTWSKAGKIYKSRAHMAPNYFLEGVSEADLAAGRKSK